ncbi:NUDIX hydrolase [Leptolyngbya iicbica]|uniref:NUDIX hydrolase n=2 Tax=Cyanophyceae TaxID=3028117 RepID=A0A4Q7E8H6_9CYAN|nr:NUDIX hydrolase [Leptolyngbya sp. LK]RZM77131.1 NUDIX hydrolase [Leptolyngbya sp. LK]
MPRTSSSATVGQPWQRAIRTLLGLLLRRPLVGVCVIPILPDGSVVLMRRRDTGLWCFPGGLIDWGEDVATAARRELAEETNLNIAKIGRLVGVYSSPQRDPRFHSICVAIEVFATGVPQVNDPTEALAVQTFSWSDAETLPLDHDHAQHLQDYLAHRIVVL